MDTKKNRMLITQQKQKRLRKGGKNTHKNYTHTPKKNLQDPDNHDGVITHLKLDIFEYEAKWSLESITTNNASRGDGILVELFQILKDDVVKVLLSIHQQIWKTQQWPQDWKSSVFIPISTEGNVQTTGKLYSFHMLIRLCSNPSS